MKETINYLVSCILYLETDHPDATHRVYAYIKTDESTGDTTYGHYDDGEWGASRLILDQMRSANISNRLCIITRYHNGPNLGQLRFQIYKTSAEVAVRSCSQTTNFGP